MAPAALFKFSPNRPEVVYNEVLEDILLTPGQVCKVTEESSDEDIMPTETQVSSPGPTPAQAYK